MSRGFRLALVGLVALAVVGGGSLWAFREDGSAAPGGSTLIHRLRAPYVSRDGVHTPVPWTPVPQQLDVVVRFDIQVQELSVTATGTTPVSIKAEARTALPGYFDNPKDTRADVFAAAHPNDAVGCAWKTVYADHKVKVTISDSGGLLTRGVRLKVDESGWHFDVTCPSNPPTHFRVPAFGEESIGGWLTLTHLGSPNGVVIDTPDYTGSPSCIKRKGQVQSTDPVFGTAKITVYAVEPGCIIPQ